MRARAVTIALLVVAAFAVVGPLAFAGDGDDAAATQPGNDSDMGGEVSTFMQSSAGETSQSVRSGMWDAAVENAEEEARADVVDDRVGDIRDRLESLEQRKQRLRAARENGSIDERTYRAKMSRLVGEMAALNRSIQRAEQDARATGANASAVDDLRDLAGRVVDSEMAAVAEDMGGGPPAEAPGGDDQGPPDEAGGPEDCPDESQDEDCPGEGNDGEGEPPDDGGPPDDNGPPGDDG